MRPLEHHEIVSIKEKRFVLEQTVALKILDVFNSEEYGLISALRLMAANALAFLLKLETRSVQDGIDIYSAMNQEKYLAMWSDRTVSGQKGLVGFRDRLNNLSQNSARLNASQCSDLIRFYGAAVEVWGARTRAGISQQDTLKQQYRPDLGTKTGTADKTGYIWGEQARFRKTPTGKATGLERAFTSPTPVSGIDLKQAAYEDGSFRSVGATVYKPRIMSTVLKIDKAFNLPVGADISGTTADSLFFIERFMNRCKMKYDPLFQLLALATLVSHRHHALLEVALTYTLNKKITDIEYAIGFFGTLAPKNVPGDTQYGHAYSEIKNVLAECEDKVQHVLVYFDPQGQLIGGYEVEPKDLGKFRELATTGENFLWRWATMPGFPTKLRIHSIMESYGLTPR